MAYVLTIGGTPTTLSLSRGEMLALTLSLDGDDEFTWHQLGWVLPPSWHNGQSVLLTIDGTPRFLGQITQVHSGFAEVGWTIGFTAEGIKNACKIAVTNPNDLTGQIVYNLTPNDPTDPDSLAANSGLSVGTILQRVFDGHLTQLAAKGIAGYVAGDLTPLTIVPPETITFAGPSLFNALTQFLDHWAGKYSCRVAWNAGTSDWRIRIVDTTALTPTTLTLGVDPIDPPEVVRDTTGTYTRVVVRGRANIEAAFLSTADGTLWPAWSAPDEAAWTWADFATPADAVDDGTVSSLTSTGCNGTSDDTSETWATNQWSTNQAWIYLINPVVSGILQTEWRRVTSNSSKAAGATAAISWAGDRPLENGGYTRYHLVGQPYGSKSDVHRRYAIREPFTGDTGLDTWVGAHLVKSSPKGVPFGTSTSVSLVRFPVGVVCWSPSHNPPYIQAPAELEVDPAHGEIRMIEPVVKNLNDQTTLDSGTGLVTPDDVRVVVFYSRGVLAAAYPADVAGVPQYSGTGYSVDGIQDTWEVDVRDWLTAADQSNMAALAQMYHETVCDSVVTASCTYHGKYSTALDLGIAINFAGDNGAPFTTGWEALNCPIRSVTLEWAGQREKFRTTMTFNNRRKVATGESLYIHPSFSGGASWEVANPFAGGITTIFNTMSQVEAFGVYMADPTARDEQGRSALDIGQSNGIIKGSDGAPTDLGAIGGMMGAGGTPGMFNPSGAMFNQGGLASTGGLAGMGGLANQGGLLDMGAAPTPDTSFRGTGGEGFDPGPLTREGRNDFNEQFRVPATMQRREPGPGVGGDHPAMAGPNPADIANIPPMGAPDIEAAYTGAPGTRRQRELSEQNPLGASPGSSRQRDLRRQQSVDQSLARQRGHLPDPMDDIVKSFSTNVQAE